MTDRTIPCISRSPKGVRLVGVDFAVDPDGVLRDLPVTSALGAGDLHQGLEHVVIAADVGAGRRSWPAPALGDVGAKLIEGVALGPEPDGLVVVVGRVGAQDAGVAGVRLERDREPFGDSGEGREREGLCAGAPEDRAPQGCTRRGRVRLRCGGSRNWAAGRATPSCSRGRGTRGLRGRQCRGRSRRTPAASAPIRPAAAARPWPASCASSGCGDPGVGVRRAACCGPRARRGGAASSACTGAAVGPDPAVWGGD